MPKQTVEFLRQFSLSAVSMGCVSQIYGNVKTMVEDDIKFVESLKNKVLSIRCALKKKKALFIKVSNTKNETEQEAIRKQILDLNIDCKPDEYVSPFEIVTFIRGAAYRAMCFASLTHCNTNKNQEKFLEFDLVFVDNFLAKCSSVCTSLHDLIDTTESKVAEVLYDKWRSLFNQIQDILVCKGFDSCFYCNLTKVESSNDPELCNDVEFLVYITTYSNELKYVLERDKQQLVKLLKSDQSNYSLYKF